MCLLVCNMASLESTASEQGKALREVQVDWLPALKNTSGHIINLFYDQAYLNIGLFLM